MSVSSFGGILGSHLGSPLSLPNKKRLRQTPDHAINGTKVGKLSYNANFCIKKKWGYHCRTKGMTVQKKDPLGQVGHTLTWV